jgi:hypothetical protein
VHRYVEAPNDYQPRPGEKPKPPVFLAGGITNCEDWQEIATTALFTSRHPLVVCNPRRANFPIHDPSASEEQIRWEYRHLHLPGGLTMLWFPACDPRLTTQPITMFELGAAVGERRSLLIGADPGYPRVRDVHIQLRLARPEITVFPKLDLLINETLRWVQNWHHRRRVDAPR